jgi:MFS family permease
VRGIGLASFLSDLGHEVPTSLLPRFVTSTLGGSAATLGLIEGIADGVAGVSRLAGGAIADDPERRRAVAVGGYASTAVLTSAIGAAQAVWQVGLLRAGGWIARGLRVPARNALLADAVPAETYGRAYGFERAMDNLGAIGGPLLALGLVTWFSVRTAILLSVIPGLLAAVVIRLRQPLRLRPLRVSDLTRSKSDAHPRRARHPAGRPSLLAGMTTLPLQHGQGHRRSGQGENAPGACAWAG